MQRLLLLTGLLFCCSGFFYSQPIVFHTTDPLNQVSGPWKVFTDQNLGGDSFASVKMDSTGAVRFAGKLNFNEGGAIAQMISPSYKHNFEEYSGISMRIKGDGKVYQLVVMGDPYNPDLPQASYTFLTKKGQWKEWTVPFREFSPSYYGVPVLDQSLDTEKIRHISFMVTDQDGKFILDIDWVKLYLE